MNNHCVHCDEVIPEDESICEDWDCVNKNNLEKNVKFKDSRDTSNTRNQYKE